VTWKTSFRPAVATRRSKKRATRRGVRAQLATMADNVRVGVRLRPFNTRELAAAEATGDGPTFAGSRAAPLRADEPAWAADAADGVVAPAGANVAGQCSRFAFDHVFDATSTNEDVYNDLAKPVVDSALAGYNGTVFAYGQTSSGKTHTMLGQRDDPGITPRAVADVMRVAKEAAGGRKYLVRVSYCEIYNEVIRDLLNEETKELKVREDGQGRTFIDAQEIVVTSVESAMKVLEQGQKVRAVGETAMNQTSSRSHTIFALIIESRGVAIGAEKSLRSSILYLVDLAGSERAKSTHAEGMRLREGAHINKSLLTLGTIINKLSSSQDTGHLPYRDSKLTRVLRQALGGNARTAILCAATPSPLHVEETLSTLKFAERAKKVRNAAVRNEITDYKAKYSEANAELLVLRARLTALEASSAVQGDGGTGMSPNGRTPPCQLSGGVFATSDPEVNSPNTSEDDATDSLDMMSSIMDQVARTVELQRSKEEIAFLRERAETAELDNAHLKELLKKKYKELRAIRARTTEMCSAARRVRGREKVLQHSMIQAYFQLEDARNNLQQSKKKGSHVLLAENNLYEISVKMAMFVPDGEFNARGLTAHERGAQPNLGNSPSFSVPTLPSDEDVPSISPLTPHTVPNGVLQSRTPLRAYNGQRSMESSIPQNEGKGNLGPETYSKSNGVAGRLVGGRINEEDPDPDLTYSKPIGVADRFADSRIIEEGPDPDIVLEKGLAELTSDTSSQDEEGSGSDGLPLSAAKTDLIKRENVARDSIREFYGGSSAMEDHLAGGHRVVR
jgi:centromeric protein E